MPLGGDRHRPGRVAEPEEAPVDSHGDAGLLDGHAKDGIEVELGANLAADRGDQPLAFERFRERVRRAGAVERQRGLGRESLQERELVPVEHLRCSGSDEDEDRRHAFFRDEWDEDGALRSDLLGEPPVDPLRAGDVIDHDGPSFEGRARDPRRLLFEIECHLAPPRRVLAGRERLETRARESRPR